MTYFPHQPAQRSALSPTTPAKAPRAGLSRDILWNQPVFKAPTLANPRVALDTLPFTATRLVRRPVKA
jgi:hypothetical protein